MTRSDTPAYVVSDTKARILGSLATLKMDAAAPIENPMTPMFLESVPILWTKSKAPNTSFCSKYPPDVLPESDQTESGLGSLSDS